MHNIFDQSVYDDCFDDLFTTRVHSSKNSNSGTRNNYNMQISHLYNKTTMQTEHALILSRLQSLVVFSPLCQFIEPPLFQNHAKQETDF